ncbi:hypothetical protein KIK84_00640 [Curvibacter sp. CHRR-16]|uniref:hypothetical protein n=1 Tax=Curvibacter sp. CHRR-16 TaxID=2835872 RepID=UPI001BDA2A05|nr:hypothetical protein [Curvibacter sp. CHRR-16]MBT0568818.1 hypothetical protein [Curvibacter sp. CHRR-16]
MNKYKLVVLALLVLLMGALAFGAWWLNRNLDGLAAQALRDYGSAMTGARVQVESVQLQATSGHGAIMHLVVGNPAGFATEHALSVERIELDIEASSLASPVVTIERVRIVQPKLIYEKANGTTNLETIVRNINRYLGPGSASTTPRRFIVRELRISDAKVQASAGFMLGHTVGMKLPDIVLKEVGSKQGGLTAGELGQTVAKALLAKIQASWRLF